MREEEESTGNENVINSNKGEEGGGGSGTGVKMGIFREGQYQRGVRREERGEGLPKNRTLNQSLT